MSEVTIVVLFRLFVIFVTVPLVELMLLRAIMGRLGPAWTVLLVVGTGFAGAGLAKQQGLRTWYRIHEQLGRGQAPTKDVIDGVMILLAGVVLIIPGILTDILGFALLVPSFRMAFGQRLASWLRGQTTAYVQSAAAENQETEKRKAVPDDGPVVIDAEFTRLAPDEEEA